MINRENDFIKIFIVAGSAIIRAGLESLLQTNEDFVVTGSAAEISISAAPFNFSVGQIIDVVLVNIEREQDLVDLFALLNDNPEETDSPSVVALLPPELQSPEHSIRALQSGVRGILPQDASTNEIATTLISAANGLISLLPETVEDLLSFSAPANLWNSGTESNKQSFSEDKLIEALTAREAEILEMMTDGASNKSIAYKLDISEHTVKFHVASIFAKLGVNTRTEAVTQALRRGLILL
jgi:DNA-binding NarL/FixJ family response regulator